ncbi:MAG TPA: ThuA domain-containing protein, partial [Candidatus Sulfopaludibacter sp.]|nr:ThuA domain-containing protein [Candidatus Sulfopaludibacter sp.]
MKRLAVMTIGAIFLTIHGSAKIRPIEVLLIDGQSGGPYHNWKLTTLILKKELATAGPFAVTVLTAPPSDGDFSGFHPEFSQYQVVVLNLDSPTWPENLRTQLEQYVRNGGGLVVVHAA